MGGHRAGEIASATALDGLRVAVDEGSPVADAVGRANTAVWDKAAGDTDLAGMGTTLTAAIFDAGTLTIAHVGDSRAYLLRDDRLERLTTDHSLVEELIRDGKLTEEQAAVHPQRSIITRALGVDSSVEVDVYSLVLQGGDRVIICSDGLTSMVRPAGIAEILREHSDPTAAANALVDAANAAGGEDNITVVVLDAVAEAKDPLPSSVAAAIRPRGASAAIHRSDRGGGAHRGRASSPPPRAWTHPPRPRRPMPDAVEPAARHRPVPRAAAAAGGSGAGSGAFLAFALPILVIVGVGIAAIGWYARNSLLRRLRPREGRRVPGATRRRADLGPDRRRSGRRSPAAASRRTTRQSVSERKEFDSQERARSRSSAARGSSRPRRRPAPPRRRPRPRRCAAVPTTPATPAP